MVSFEGKSFEYVEILLYAISLISSSILAAFWYLSTAAQ